MKVIKIRDNNYAKLLEILHAIEKERNERVSFDDVISHLISWYEKVGKDLKVNKVT